MEIWNRYGPTAARVHGKPGRAVRPSSLTIDVHSHVAVPEAAQFVKPHLDFGSMPPRLIRGRSISARMRTALRA